jgi:hypothetical protein
VERRHFASTFVQKLIQFEAAATGIHAEFLPEVARLQAGEGDAAAL